MTPPLLGLREVGWLVAALLGGLAPHLARLPVLLSAGIVGASLWRLLGAQGRVPLPDRAHPLLWLLKQGAAIAAFVSVYVAYRGQLGREAGVELLAALLGLKLLEMRSARDYYLVAFLCYFLVVTNFFYSQTPATALYMLVLVLFVTTVLIQFNTPPSARRVGDMAALSLRMTVAAMPLMLIAFVLFPRLPGPLWGLPQDAFDGVSGLSEELTLGEVARLGLSDEIAFRVSFGDTEPRARDLYWRGPVLWTTDGRTWRTGRVGDGSASAVTARGPAFHYEVTLEPHGERWLPALDLVTEAAPGTRISSDHRLLARVPVRRRQLYALTSVVDYRWTGLDDATRAAALALPDGWHPRSRALAARWRAQAAGPRAIVEQALAYYRDGAFYYSLTPPAPGADAVDGFLFETREGFCEHFAASFVVLMRAAGIPARIVTGYQGGELNALADYHVVRQRDAHAWAEIYDEGGGWTRVDPTAAVAPERVALGSDAVLGARRTLAGDGRAGVGAALLGRLREGVDALTYRWNQWVLGYSAAAQQRLLERWGFPDIARGDLVIALTGVLAAGGALLGWLILRAPRRARDPAAGAWARLSARLRPLGLARAPSEAPHAWAARVALARPDLAAEIEAITGCYTAARYGRDACADATRELRRRVRRFRPRRPA